MGDGSCHEVRVQAFDDGERGEIQEGGCGEAAEQKSRKPLISLKKSWICGFHLTIGVTGFELGGFSPIITVNTAFHEILDKSLDKS